MLATNNSSSSGRCQFDTDSSRFDAFLFILIALVTASGSIIVFICYARHRALRNPTNVFIISLSSSDFLVAVLSIPYSFAVFLCPPVDKRTGEDVMYLLCDMIPSILSIFSLSLVAVDRAIAITNPFFHTKYVNKRSAGIAVVIMWVLVLSIVAFIYILDREDFTLFIIFMAYVIPVFVMITSYSVIGYVGRQHGKATNFIEKTSLRLDDANNCGGTSGNLEEGDDSTYSEATDTDAVKETIRVSENRELAIKSEDKGTLIWLRKNFCRKLSRVVGIANKREGLDHIKREFKAALSLSLLLSVFVIAWTPFMALNIKMYVCPSCEININLVKYFKFLHYLNSALNPMIYVILNKRWRVAFRMALPFVNKGRGAGEVTITEVAEW